MVKERDTESALDAYGLTAWVLTVSASEAMAKPEVRMALKRAGVTEQAFREWHGRRDESRPG